MHIFSFFPLHFRESLIKLFVPANEKLHYETNQESTANQDQFE
jgi:hypothetical protein